MCVTTINAELFFRLKSPIILVLDRLQCVARVNCLVSNKTQSCSTADTEISTIFNILSNVVG